jgi:hypothetical protein
MPPEKPSMPLFILFDSKTGYLYGHLMASGPDDPFLNDMLEWWSTHCSAVPIGLDTLDSPAHRKHKIPYRPISLPYSFSQFPSPHSHTYSIGLPLVTISNLGKAPNANQ